MGRLEVVCGPMFSGKSEELIRRVRRTMIARRPVWVFKPTIDGRYSKEEVVSHDGRRVEAVPTSAVSEILTHLDRDGAWHADPGTIAIDEAQFYAPDETDLGALEVVEELFHKLLRSPHRVVVSGLDLDFRGHPFGIMPRIMAIADRVDKLTAVCQVCGDPATRSQRLIDGEPAPFNAPVVLVGGQESYEARCLTHWDDGRDLLAAHISA